MMAYGFASETSKFVCETHLLYFEPAGSQCRKHAFGIIRPSHHFQERDVFPSVSGNRVLVVRSVVGVLEAVIQASFLGCCHGPIQYVFDTANDNGVVG